METNQQVEEIKRMVANIPDLPGWAVTYNGDLKKDTLTKLKVEGYTINKILGKDGYFYKIKDK